MNRIAELLKVTMLSAIVFLLYLLSLTVEASHFHGAMTAWRVQKKFGNGTILVSNSTTFCKI